jgi:hypothetical protein
MTLTTNGGLSMFASAAVNADVPITLHTPDDESVSILFGEERFTLEFYDVESLERLRNLADEGARRLRQSQAVDNSPNCG